MKRLLTTLALAFVASIVSVGSVLAVPAHSELDRPVFARWDKASVTVYVDPTAKGSGWSLPKVLRAWSAGPIQLQAGSSPDADITITEIPHSRRFHGNAAYVHYDGVFDSCHITLADNTRDWKRAHVAAHEVGHCLGLPHVSEYHSVMDAWLRGPWEGPTDPDIAWLTGAYAQ